MSLSTSGKLKVELRGHTALITIDNPGANTWDTESLPALKNLVEKFHRDEILRVYAPLFVKNSPYTNSAESLMNRLKDANPNYVAAVRQAKDLYNWLVSAIRMLEAMYELRLEYYDKQDRPAGEGAERNLLTNYAYENIDKARDIYAASPVSLLQNFHSQTFVIVY